MSDDKYSEGVATEDGKRKRGYCLNKILQKMSDDKYSEGVATEDGKRKRGYWDPFTESKKTARSPEVNRRKDVSGMDEIKLMFKEMMKEMKLINAKQEQLSTEAREIKEEMKEITKEQTDSKRS
ncbi:hypothetical protein QE152_g12519 [Popillia japonica]|uniref:Uncharacterized protein n=1 Tax=Popillia japonica TaxID=7064 RepID=A0AAW1LNZ7_POPJA